MKILHRLCGLLALVFAFVPGFALASVGPVSGTQTVGRAFVSGSLDAGEWTFHVWSVRSGDVDSAYSAACYALGVDPSSLDANQKAYLSDVEFCPGFVRFSECLLDGYSENPPVALLPYLSIGMGNRWGGVASVSIVEDAVSDLDMILRGDFPSGGGVDSSYVFGGYVRFKSQSGSNYFLLGPNNTRYTSNLYYTNYYLISDYMTVIVPSGVLSNLESVFPSEDYKYSIRINWQTGNLYTVYVSVPSGPAVFGINQEHNANSYIRRYESYYDSYISFTNNAKVYNFDGTLLRFSYDSPIAVTNSNPSIFLPDIDNYAPQIFIGELLSSSPESSWPDEPAIDVPSPPELPTPHTPVMPDPPSDPIPHDPVDTTIPGYTDVIDWLKAIYSKLVFFINDVASHCVHIQTMVRDTGVYVADVIEACFSALQTDLFSLFSWLAEQFEFTFYGDSGAGYDDSSILSWLKLIYLKLGGGSSAPDIGIDPVGFFTWLLQTLNGIFSLLLSGLSGIVDGMVNAVDGLSGIFPFSLPWDLVFVIGLFAAEPVTPVFDLPFALPESVLRFVGEQHVNEDGVMVVHVDCEPLDDIASVVRLMVVAFFTVAIIKITPPIIEVINGM